MSNSRFYHDEHIFLDLEKVLMIAGDDERFDQSVIVYFKDNGTACFRHPRVGDLIAAMVAYTSPPPSTVASHVLSALQPNPLKPGVISAPEEKLDNLRRTVNAPNMSSVQVGHGPETSSQDIVAPEAHPPKEGEDEWRCSSCNGLDSNSSTEEEEEDEESIPIHNIQ